MTTRVSSSEAKTLASPSDHFLFNGSSESPTGVIPGTPICLGAGFANAIAARGWLRLRGVMNTLQTQGCGRSFLWPQLITDIFPTGRMGRFPRAQMAIVKGKVSVTQSCLTL